MDMYDIPMDSLVIIGVPVTPYLAGAYDITKVAENERTLVVLDDKEDAAGLTEALAELQRRIEWYETPRYVPYKINGKLRYGEFEFQQENGEHKIVIVR